MKKSLIAAMFLIVSMLILAAGHGDGAEFVWPREWTAFGPIPPDAAMAAGGLPERDTLPADHIFRSIPDQIELDGEVYPARPVVFKYGRIDFKNLFYGAGTRPHRRGERVYLFAQFETTVAQSVRIGAGADWFMQWWLNGRSLFDTLAGGNGHAPVAMTNHFFEIELSPGEHVLAVMVAAGRGGWMLAAGGPREVAAGVAEPAPAPPPKSDYRQEMETGRKIHAASSGAASGLADFAAAAAAFRRAVDLAATDNERVRASLELGNVLLADPAQLDYDVIHAIFEQVSGMAGIEPNERAEALLGIAGVYLSENNCAAARQTAEKVIAMTDNAYLTAAAQMLIARAYFQERDYSAAATWLRRLLQMGSPEPQLVWEAEALLGVIEILPMLSVARPRLFVSPATWPLVREHALAAERQRFERLRDQLRGIAPDEIQMADWSGPVMDTAFMYRMTGDDDILFKTRRMLRAGLDFIHAGAAGDSRAYPRIAWATAFDWVWDDLPPDERRALAGDMLDYAWMCYTGARLRNRLTVWPHYYTNGMFWYVGLALADADLDDVAYARALTLLGAGFQQYRTRIRSLLERAGTDGVWQTNLDYDFGEVPGMIFTFFYSWRPAFDVSLPVEWAVAGLDPEYALRHVIDLGRNSFRYFNWAGHSNGSWGFGSNHSAQLYDYLGHYLHFFGQNRPRDAAMAGYLRERMLAAGAGGVEMWDRFPVFHFLRTGLASAPAPELPGDIPPGRYYEKIGLVLASSGFDAEDTYMLFAVGGGPSEPRVRADMDAGHFSLYRKGWMALDTGTRFAMPHSANYRHQTVAHNCILIRMPGEKFPASHTGPVISNAGGQNRDPSHARVLAFESRDNYVYAATDLTPTYHEDKCTLMIRQLLFVPPRHVVVFDRVRSVKAEYPKTWLLHTSNEPELHGRAFYADQDRGRILCRTFLPADAVLEKIGGPGKEFWADGKNWPVTDAMQAPGAGDWWKRFGRGNSSPPEGMGRWRVEVKPGAERAEDFFLHLIELTDQDVDEMAAAEMAEDNDRLTLSFSTDDGTVAVSFNKIGEVGGYIRIQREGEKSVERELRRDIMPRSGLIRQLTDTQAVITLDGDSRSVAAMQLAGAGQPAVRPLIKALKADDAGTRRRAAWALGEIKSPEPVRDLGRLLHDQDGFVRAAASAALSKIGDPAVDVLLEILQPAPTGKGGLLQKLLPARSRTLAGGDASARLAAAQALGTIGASRSVSGLAAMINDGDTAVRRAAVLALGYVKDSDGISALGHAIRADDPRMREFAVWAFVQIGAPAVVALVDIMGDERVEVRAAAIAAAIGIGESSRNPCVEAVGSDNLFRRAAAAEVLGEIGGDATVLKPLLKDENGLVRAAATRALGMLDASDMLAELRAMLKDEDAGVRAAAAEALGMLKDQSALNYLTDLLVDDSAPVRRAAIVAMGSVGAPESVDAVVKALEDKEPMVRIAAASALGVIGDARAVDPLIDALGDTQRAVAFVANASLVKITGHQRFVPVDWPARTIRQHFKPGWERWREQNSKP